MTSGCQLMTRSLGAQPAGSLNGIWIPSSSCGAGRLRPGRLLDGLPSVERVLDDRSSGRRRVGKFVITVDVTGNHWSSVDDTRHRSADHRRHGSLRRHRLELLWHQLLWHHMNCLPAGRLRHGPHCRIVIAVAAQRLTVDGLSVSWSSRHGLSVAQIVPCGRVARI